MSKRRSKSAPKRRRMEPGKGAAGAGGQADAHGPAVTRPAQQDQQSTKLDQRPAADTAASAGEGQGTAHETGERTAETPPHSDAPQGAAERASAGQPPDARAASTRGRRPAARDASAAPRGRASTEAPQRSARGPRLAAQAGILAAVFALVTLIAELAGAANLGVALGVGQIAFLIALMALLLRS